MMWPSVSPSQTQGQPPAKPRRAPAIVPTMLDGTGSSTSAASRPPLVSANIQACASVADSQRSPGSSPMIA